MKLVILPVKNLHRIWIPVTNTRYATCKHIEIVICKKPSKILPPRGLPLDSPILFWDLLCVQLCVFEHLCVRDIKWKEGKTSEWSDHVFCVIICHLWTDLSHSLFDVISPCSLSHRPHDICEEIHSIPPSSYLQEHYIVSSKPALQLNSPRTYHVSPPRRWILFPRSSCEVHID